MCIVWGLHRFLQTVARMLVPSLVIDSNPNRENRVHSTGFTYGREGLLNKLVEQIFTCAREVIEVYVGGLFDFLFVFSCNLHCFVSFCFLAH